MELRSGKVKKSTEEDKTKPRYFKLLRKDLTHYGFKYTPSSLNVDPKPFNPIGQCKPGGLYFFNHKQLKKCFKFFNLEYVHYIAEVFLPEDAQIHHEEGKSKADKFVLGELREFWKDYELCMLSVKQNMYLLEYIDPENFTQTQCLFSF